MDLRAEEEIVAQQQVRGAIRMDAALERERREDLPTGGDWSRRCDVALRWLPLWEVGVGRLEKEVEEEKQLLPSSAQCLAHECRPRAS